MEDFSSIPIQGIFEKRHREEEQVKKRPKKPERNPKATNINNVILKDLMEARVVDNEVVTLDLETSEFIEGKVRGNETSKSKTPIYCGETFLYEICEPISTINIMPSSLYE